MRVVHPTNPNARSKHHSVGVISATTRELPNHFHEPEETFVVLDGTATLTYWLVAVEVSVGDFIFIPAWSEHALENTGTDVFKFIVITAPANP